MSEIIPLVSLLAAWLAGGTLLVAGLSKLRSPARFASSLSSYALIPGPARKPFSWSLPAVEVLLGATLIAGVERAFVAPAVAALFLAFAAVLAFSFGLRGDAECGCFGAAGRRARTSLLVGRNVALAVLAAVAWAGTGSSGVGELPLLVAFTTAVLAVLAASVPVAAPSRVDSPTPRSADRRRFLKLAASAVAGAVAAASLGAAGRTAEAACSGCGSCGYDYIFSYCVGGCCAVYWVRPYKYCVTSCPACSGWYETYCGIPSCC